jgi:hypothetical protein
MAALFLYLTLGISTLFLNDVPITTDPAEVNTDFQLNSPDDISSFNVTGYSLSFIAYTFLMDWGWCGHGGPGTKACSVGIGLMSCSIECGDGKHACCSFFWGCRCRDDAPEEPTENEQHFYVYLQ